MKTIKVFMLIVTIIVCTTGGLFAGDKYYVPSWGMPTGDITKFPKGHEATANYTPNLAVNYDKQHISWFKSTLKPQNLRKEGRRDLLEELEKWIRNFFKR